MVKKKDPGANRSHRERSQTSSRSRLGLLEKHKDYVLRARDYKSKQNRLKKLREKAAFRNKDEFYWGMVKGQTKGGVAVGDRGNESLSVDVVRLLKTQDVGYVRMQIAKDQKKVDKLRRELESILPPADPSSEWDAVRELKEVESLAEMGILVVPREEALAMSSSSASGKKKKAATKTHTIFADDREAFESATRNVSHRNDQPVASSSKVTLDEDLNDAPVEVEDLGWDDLEVPSSRSTKPVRSAETDPDVEEESAKELQNRRLHLYGALSAHLTRIRQLRIAETKLSTHIGLYGKGSARKVQNAGWVDDETAEENRNGERKRLQRDVYKYKLPRRK